MTEDIEQSVKNYCYSTDGYEYSPEEFDSIESAFEECISDIEDEEGFDNMEIYVGKLKPFPTFTSILDLEFTFQRMEEDAHDEFGEIAEGWLTVTTPQAKELESLIEGWASKHGYQPTFRQIGQVTTFTRRNGVVVKTETR